MSDNVEHPSHYNAGGVETIEGIRAALGDGFSDYCLGNVLKYAWRCKHKGKLLEDLRKAAKYLQWAIEAAESNCPKIPDSSSGKAIPIPEGWRELEPDEMPKVTDLYENEGVWRNRINDSSIEYARYEIRHIRKIEAFNPSETPNSSTWIPKVGDKVRVRVPVLYPTRDSCNYEGRITEISQSGRYTIFFASEDQRIRGWVKPKDLHLIEAAS